jgi:hypothetical protein
MTSTSAEGYPSRRTCATQREHRRLLNEDTEYVAARARIETDAFLYRVGAKAPQRVGITRIPVVVHVVWNTDQQNISDAQIASQFSVLNQDFRKANADIGNVPPVWQPIAADTRIEFILATTDPSGAPTTGITRTQTSIADFEVDDNQMKSTAAGGIDPWSPGKYLNIWIVPRLHDDLTSGILGYAYYPGAQPDIDGVVIVHDAFGTTGTAAAPFNLGRTATHEIGHWLNLIHIWGDDGSGCGGTDEVDDTPNAADENYSCPQFPEVSCNNSPDGDMFVNYMDYVDDVCMCMFTTGQVTRMQATLDGPRASIGV